MSFLKKSGQTAISQGKYIDLNNFLSFAVIGIFFSDLYFLLKYYFFYDPVLNVILLFGLGGVCFGDLLGRFLYSKLTKTRLITVLSETVFCAGFIIYALRDLITKGSGDLFLESFFAFKYGFPALLFLVSIFFGIKTHYSLRISCAEYVEKKGGTERFAGALLAGSLFGIALAGIFFSFDIRLFYLSPLGLLLLVSIRGIDLPYDPAPLRVAASADEEPEKERGNRPERRADAVLYTYLNFLSVLLYAYLGFVAISKYYGDTVYVGAIFVVLLLAALLGGYLAGGGIKAPYLHVYGASLFPIAFLVFISFLMNYNQGLHFIIGILLFAPVGFLLGMVLRLSVRALCSRWDDKKRATVLEFSLIILPAPILISLGLVDFTNLLYYGIVCAVMLINVLIPSISMINHDMKAVRKGLYYFFSLLFLPMIVFMVLYFRLPMNNDIYATRVKNFNELRNINYNADYIRTNAVITMGGNAVFAVNDSVIRNLKRALAPLSLHHPENKTMLVVDGNQRFFRNPVIGYYNNSICLDLLADRDVDYNRLPFSGTQKYVPDNHSLLIYLERSRIPYFTIVDVPNLLDQAMNRFRFSGEYYRLMKGRLESGGLFAQVFNVPGCRPELFANAMLGLRATFKNHLVYYFSNILVVLASDGDGIFTVRRESYERLVSFLRSHEELRKVFLNEPHLLAHLFTRGVDELLASAPERSFIPALMLTGAGQVRIPAQAENAFMERNRLVFDLIAGGDDQRAFILSLAASFQPDDAVISLLKRTELAEAREKYTEETELLFELKKQAEYRISLQEYVRSMLAYKEKYYYAAALRLEKDRKWDEARELYLAVLKINPDNFDANYRMGLLCITLQDIEGSFNYFQEAMRINRDHPRVLFQLGILYYSSGKTVEAIEYLNRALLQNQKLQQAYRYLGLCYEKLENLQEAEGYYARALLADPNDTDTKARLDVVRMKIEQERKKWEIPERKNDMDVEQDSDIPLPVSKGAYDIRLKDNDSALPEINPLSSGGTGAEKGESGAIGGPPTEKNQ